MPQIMEHSSGTVFVFLTAFKLLRKRIESKEQHERYLCNRRRARRLRFYCQQKVQCVMFHLFLLSTVRGALELRSERTVWTKTRSSDWWERIVLESFQEDDWQENFRMSHVTFVYICNELRCRLLRQNTTMRQAITV